MGTTTVTTRTYSPTDFLRLEMLGGEWAETHRRIAQAMLSPAPYERCILLWAGETFAGYIYGWVLRDLLIPQFVYVLPEYRGRGYARELERELEREAGTHRSLIYYERGLREHYKKYGYEPGDLEVAVKEY